MNPSLSPPVLHALARIRAAIRDAPPQTLGLLYYALIGLAGDALAGVGTVPVYEPTGQYAKASQEEPDEAITAGQSARLSGWHRGRSNGDRGGFSPRWFYDHADELPFRIGGRGRHPVRFSRNGLREWLRAH